MGKKKVTKEELYKYIAKLDVVMECFGEYPYKHVFSMRNGGIVAEMDSRRAENSAIKIIDDCYIYVNDKEL